MSNEQPKLAEEMKKMEYDEILPIEKKLVAWSIGIGVVLANWRWAVAIARGGRSLLPTDRHVIGRAARSIVRIAARRANHVRLARHLIRSDARRVVTRLTRRVARVARAIRFGGRSTRLGRSRRSRIRIGCRGRGIGIGAGGRLRRGVRIA